VVIGDFVGLECEERFDPGSPTTYVVYMYMLMIYETKYMCHYGHQLTTVRVEVLKLIPSSWILKTTLAKLVLVLVLV
jgi:hypothetical protein